MNRKSFLKKLGIGVVAVAVAPKVFAETNVPSDYTEGIVPFIRRQGTTNNFLSTLTVGLFKDGNEVQYWDYRRMESFLSAEKGGLKLSQVTFPRTPEIRMIEADEVRIFNKNSELVGTFFIGLKQVMNGFFTIQF